MRLIADIETDGLLDECTKIHSLVIEDFDTGEIFSCADQPGYLSVETGLRKLLEADVIVFHNGIKFDLPVIDKLYLIEKMYSWCVLDPNKVFDTLTCSRLIWSDLADRDWAKLRSKSLDMAPTLAGSHSLEAWGYRMGLMKGDYAKIKEAEAKALGIEDKQEIIRYTWARWTPEMQEYCVQDVKVTRALYALILGKQYAPRALELEHAVSVICAQQERNGFLFDVKGAEKLYTEILCRHIELGEELRVVFKPWYKASGPVKTPKRPNRRYGYSGHKDENGVWHGYPYTPLKHLVFNPGSRDHIADRLIKLHKWKPREFTSKGGIKIDETILSQLKYPEAPKLTEYLTLQKLLGQIGDGKNAWLKFVKPSGRIHGSIKPGGAVTGRATHSAPNIAQVPSSNSPYGNECRALFIAPEGRVLLGCDVSGLELRMLAHYMAKHDDGKYGEAVVDGDVHWENVQALGLVPMGTVKQLIHGHQEALRHSVFRNGTKTFIYAFLYGAGGAKICSVVQDIAAKEIEKGLGDHTLQKFFGGRKRLTKAAKNKIGNDLKATFLKRTPALKKLIEGVSATAKRKGRLIGLDGRYLHIRSDHAALNTLLQSAGALVCKRWMVEFWELLKTHGLHNRVSQVAWVHDELQLEVDEDVAQEVGELCVRAIELAGEYFEIRMPLTGEFKIGKSWKDTH